MKLFMPINACSDDKRISAKTQNVTFLSSYWVYLIQQSNVFMSYS